MRRLLALLAFTAAAKAQQPFTLQQILSAPYALSLTAAPVGNNFAWVENAEGVRNIWIAAPNQPARKLTHYTEDDGQDIANLTWSPDAQSIAYVYGAETGASGKPANPDEMHGQPLHIWLQPLDPAATAQDLGEGRAPLFMHGGCGLFFLRGGKIWARGFLPARVPHSIPLREQGLTPPPEAPLLCETKEQGPFQLVTDRGSAQSLTLSPDGNVLAYISHRAGHSFLALYDVTALILKFPAPSTGNDSAPAFSPDSKSLAWLRFPSTDAPEFATNRTSPNPWSIQLATLDTHAVHVTTRTLFTPEANKPGSVLPRMSTGEPHLYWTAPLDPSPTLSSRPERSAVERPAVSSGAVLFFSEADGWVHLYSIDPATNAAPVLLTPDEGEIEDAILSRDGKSLIYASAGAFKVCVGHHACVHDYPEPDARDIRTIWKANIDDTNKLGLRDPLTPDDVIGTHPVQLADGTLAALISSAQYPMHPAVLIPKPVAYNNEPNEPLSLRPSFTSPTYPAKSFVKPQRVVFNARGEDLREWLSDFRGQVFNADPDHIHGQLFLPVGVEFTPDVKTHQKHPAILFFHGGPKRQMLLGYPAMDYYSNAYAMNQYLASRGYIVLSVNYRGGIGYGLNFRQCEHCGADGAAEYNDVLAAAAYLRSRPDVDAAHIGIWGGSYGGYLTALALARNSDIFAAGVDFHGVHEWAREDNARSDWLDRPGTTLEAQEKIAATAHASSPMADIDHWRSPVLLIHGDDDPEVAYTQTPMLADALRARNIHVEELIFPDELHGFLLHRDWLAAYQAASDFFDRTLKPATTPRK
jgi:dipeptidyl aminopeptidase/acylaminoacyl peptidase